MVEILERGDVLEIVKPRRWGRWSLQESRYLVCARLGVYPRYEIDLFSFNTHQLLEYWLIHIQEAYDPPDFLQAMKAIFGQVIWQDKTFSGKDLVIAYWQASKPTEG